MKNSQVPKKAVAIVIGQLTQGGSERQLYLFLQHCDRSRWDPIVYVSGELGEWEAPISDLGIPIILLQGNAVAKMWQFRRSCRAHNVSRFFSWSSYTNGYGLALIGLNIPRIGSFRNSHFADLPERFRWLWSLMSLHGISTAVCNSRETLADITVHAAKQLQAIYIPNSVQPVDQREHYRQLWRERLEIQPNEILILGVGRLVPQKNFARFIEAVALINQDIPIRAVIAGSDEGSCAELNQLISRLRLQPGHIRLIGSVIEARKLMCAADIFVLSSDHEGMPNVVLEAMAAQVACVCTRVNGIAELIEDGINGFITEHSAATLAERIQYLANHSDVRQQIGARAAASVQQSYSTTMISAQLWQLCE